MERGAGRAVVLLIADRNIVHRKGFYGNVGGRGCGRCGQGIVSRIAAGNRKAGYRNRLAGTDVLVEKGNACGGYREHIPRQAIVGNDGGRGGVAVVDLTRRGNRRNSKRHRGYDARRHRH